MLPKEDPELLLHLYRCNGFVFCGREITPPYRVYDSEGKPTKRKVTNTTFIVGNETCMKCRGEYEGFKYKIQRASSRELRNGIYTVRVEVY